MSKKSLQIIFFYRGATSPAGQGLLIIEDSWQHSDTPQSVGLLWASDQLDAETSTWQHITLTTNIQAPGGIRTHNPSKQAAAVPRLRPRGQLQINKIHVSLTVTIKLFLCKPWRRMGIWITAPPILNAGSGWCELPSHPGRSIPCRRAPVLMGWEAVWAQFRSEKCQKEKSLSPAGSDPQFPDHPVASLAYCALCLHLQTLPCHSCSVSSISIHTAKIWMAFTFKRDLLKVYCNTNLKHSYRTYSYN
jgi:hypothetical protein